MSKMRNVKVPPELGKPPRTVQMTNLEWALQFVLWKVQEQIFYNRKTDMCGVILSGSDETMNKINNERPDEYTHVVEYIPIEHPTPDTLAKIASLQPSKETNGDALDGLIVALDAQNRYLGTKQTWTRKMIVITDGENAIETANYKQIIETMNANEVMTSVVGVDFDDPEFGYQEDNKSNTKRLVEKFWRDKFIGRLNDGLFATMEYALEECARPEIKEVRSALGATVLRFGDSEKYPEQSIVINVRTSKATAKATVPPIKRFSKVSQPSEGDRMEWEGENETGVNQYAQVKRRTEYFLKSDTQEGGEGERKALENSVKVELDNDGEVILRDEEEQQEDSGGRPLEPDSDMQMAYKYGATCIPTHPADFQQLGTEKGLDILGFIPYYKFRREWAMGEVFYIWADTESGRMQIQLSSIIQAMIQEDLYAVIRMVAGTNFAPKIGIAVPRMMERADCLLWVQMPFAEDSRNYAFQSLDRVFNRKGIKIEKHSSIPTEDQIKAMEKFVDSMDLMQVEKDEEGNRFPWFDTLYSYNPTLHRVKQALFHAAIAKSLSSQPLPEPHPELTKYFTPPKKVLKRSREPLEECRKRFKIRQAPPTVVSNKSATLVEDREDEPLLLGPVPLVPKETALPSGEFTQFKHHEQDQELVEGEQDTLGEAYVNVKTSPGKEGILLKHMPQSPEKSNDVLVTCEDAPVKKDEEIKPKIVGTTTPLEDFKAVVTGGGDEISEAVVQLADVIKELVMGRFPNRRKEELLECMRFLRETCLAEDEIVAWNEFLRELKTICLSSKGVGSRPFWEAVKRLGSSITLIGKSEATKSGARYAKFAVKDDIAKQFLEE